MLRLERVVDVDRGHPEDEENLHWPADESGDEDEGEAEAAKAFGESDLDPVESDVDAEEEELHWAIQQESSRDDW